jgi:hypothetical protein
MSKFEIERRTGLSYKEFAGEYLYANKPVIVADAINQWNALKRWTPEFFKCQFGEMKFVINDAEYGQEGFKESDEVEFTMSQFIDRVLESTEENPAPYFRNKILYDLFPTLTQDIKPLPEYFQPNWLGERYLVGRVGKVLNRGAAIELYIGGRGGAFPVLHYDGAGTHAFLMQIYGRKQYIVYPPEQEPYLYSSSKKINHSLINSVENPDLGRFPLFANAVATTFFLDPGELLFVPCHWWHTAKILSPSITISVNVLNQSNWHELVKYFAMQQHSSLVSLAGRAYLTGAGAWRSWRDRSWRKRAEAQAAYPNAMRNGVREE